MRKTRILIRDVILPISLIVLLGLFMTIMLYFIVDRAVGYHLLNESNSEKKLEGFVKIIGVSISITGFASLIITIIQFRKHQKQTIQESTISLYKEFRGIEFKDTRARAWRAATKWYDEAEYKASLSEYGIGEKTVTNIEYDKDLKAIYSILEFYMIISVYNEGEEALKALNFFYYGWWRHFLYDFSLVMEESRSVNPLIHKLAKNYLVDVSYTSHLRKLDKLCGLSKIPITVKIHRNGN